jgi:hypothetical protein
LVAGGVGHGDACLRGGGWGVEAVGSSGQPGNWLA